MAIMALAAMTACTSEDSINDVKQPEEVTAPTYSVCIKASFGGDAQTRAVSFEGTTSSSTFQASEQVYVYNATRKQVMLNAEGTAAGCLTPTNISADGKSCDLTGTLTGSAITATDQLLLMYNLNDVYPGNVSDKLRQYSYFRYNGQNGTATGVTDGATATMTGWSIDGGVLTTTGTAQFQNVQSMFRFSFKDNDTGDDLSVKQVYITSQNNALVRSYYPMMDEASRYSKYGVGMSNGEAVSGFIYMALCIDEASSAADVLTFEVTDGGGNKYEGTKAAPATGFVNGKYYYSSAPIALTLKERRIMPTITWTTPASAPETIGDEMIVIEDANADFALSGTSEGVCFVLNQNGTVRLNGLTASYGGDMAPFISGNSDITLDISGANTVACKNYNYSILVQDNLKLQGYGTLTVTASNATECGIRGNANYAPGNSWQAETNANATTDELDVSEQLAATGYKVVRSARTDNADGTYSWTYTVSPSLAMPLTMQALTAGTIVVNNPQSGMQYSKNGGDKTAVTSDAITVAVGDKVQLYGSGTSIASYYPSSNDYTEISGGTAEVKVYGNIMSLVDETGYASNTTLPANNAFNSLFHRNTNLKDASGLLLPATTLTLGCYGSMFYGCTSLTAAPALPATTLNDNCYKLMFRDCTSLTTAPALPATKLDANCYMTMFYGCTSLTTAPALPATTLYDHCYDKMFYGCTSLTTAPALPAETLANYCYWQMFYKCSNLKSVTCLATNISATDCTKQWLYKVASSGTFTKAASMTGWTTGVNGKPSGWTVVDAQ